jgi:hypothetical protein
VSIATAFLLLTPSAASATSVNLVWINSAGGPIDSVSGNSVSLNQSGVVVTLTLDVQLAIDSRGVAGAFLTFTFDTDLKNELDLVS